jgi:nucleoid DNA-binding protein
MTKQELVDTISEKTGISKDVVTLVINETNEAIIAVLQKGDPVKISGFGTFYTKTRKGRVGRNPKTGETVEIQDKTVPKFRAGKQLKEAF